MPVTTNVYIDAFNLYYGCLKGTPYRWLDLASLCRKLLPGDHINRIRYFTAEVNAWPGNPHAPLRQNLYLRALGTLPEVDIHYGYFLTSVVQMRLAHPIGLAQTVEVVKTEEKGTDVNLASHLLVDACRRDCDVAVVITNDSDLAEPIRLAQSEFGVPVGLVYPRRRGGPSPTLLATNPLFYKRIREGVLRYSQFPEEMKDGQGTFRRPAQWR
ncbi:MAG: NYN domain-containing protein [Mycobacteriales bacterium]